MTADGGFLHPVVVVGLKPGANGQAIVDALVDRPSKIVRVAPGLRPGQSTMRIESGEFALSLPYGVTSDALVLALSPADIDRRISGKVRPIERVELKGANVQAMRWANPLGLWSQLWLYALFDIGEIGDASVIASALLATRGALQLRVVGAEDRLGVVVDWPELPTEGPGAADLNAAIQAELVGDGLSARDGYLRAAAAAPDGIVRESALARVGADGSAIVAIGVLSAVAIPTFMKSVRRSKTSEADMNVRKLADASISHYQVHGAFPPSAPRTPSKTACVGGESVKHAPTAESWKHPTWQALNFAIDDPHYYQYEYISDGQSFTARAVGDLDCNGVLSTFEKLGAVDAEGNLDIAPGVSRTDELE